MCDMDTLNDSTAFLQKQKLSRRQFAMLGAGASASFMLPAVANAQAVTEQDVEITTPDGSADCYFVHPAAGASAAVLIWPDILGLRPAFLIAIAENDDAAEPMAKETLKQAFAAAGLAAEIEVYAETLHGWCPPDSAVYHEPQAEKAWSRTLALFETALA